ncbi:MAG: hemin uptake protein HemP [Aestuariivita sp.]|uniref:hemin uptake protein HemP n=1 Tax=Aestuariivita sp. TaxID=1872407 RepID=UPI003BB10DB7
MSDASTQSSRLPEVPVHDVLSLVGPDGRAGLTLNGMVYILRITKSGKLILTK